MCPPTKEQQNSACTSYADDFPAKASGQKFEDAASVLASHAADVDVWVDEISLEISSQKSTVTVLTPQTQQAHFNPKVPLNEIPLPLHWNPKILRVTFVPLFHFHKHVHNVLKYFTFTLWH